MKKVSNLLIIIILGISLGSCFPTKKATSKSNPEIKNIILMIGDGMGLPDVYAAMTISNLPLNIERCDMIGLQKTFSADNHQNYIFYFRIALTCGFFCWETGD